MRFSHISILVFACMNVCFAQTSFNRNSFTVAATALSPVSGQKLSLTDPGAGFSLQYDFRATRYLALEAGVQTAWPKDVATCSKFGCVFERSAATFTPFGLRGILPLNHDRLHITAGVGGAYVFRGMTDRSEAEEWLAQASIGFTVSLTHEGTIHIGPSVRAYSDLGRPTQRWIATSVEFTWTPRF